MSYLSLYRKWRPQSFADVVGQEHVVRTLRNALDMGRCAHAYIFSGPRGTGKTSLARLLAKGLNCEQGPTGQWCNSCDNCQRIAKGHSVDVIEIDGASNRGIDEIRDVREKVKFAPAEGRYKVYIIDEVHMLTTEAFNALLKVLEEPPAHVVFVFATTEAYRIPATIVSRCQKFDFYGFSPDQVAEQVRRVATAEGANIDEGAIHLIARHAAGGMRDALGYLDQCISFAKDGITESLVAQVLGVVEQEQLHELGRAVAAKDVAKCLSIVKAVGDAGRDLRQFARDAVQFFRDLMLLKAAPGRDGLVVLWGDDLKTAQEIATSFEVTQLLRIVERLGQAEADMRWAQITQLPLEIALIELLRGEGETATSSAEVAPAVESAIRNLTERIAALEARGVPAVSAPSAPRTSSPAPTQTPRLTPPASASTPAPTPKPVQEPAREPARTPTQAQTPPSSATSTAPPPGPASSAASGFLKQVQSEWQKVLDYLRASKFVQQEAFLREGMPGSYNDGVLTIYFSPNHRFHQANIAQEKNRDIVQQAIKRVFNEDVTLDVVLGEVPRHDPMAGSPVAHPVQPSVDSIPAPENQPATKEVAPPSEAEPAAPSSDQSDPSPPWDEPAANPNDASDIKPEEIDDPLLKAAMELFDGTITRIERKEDND